MLKHHSHVTQHSAVAVQFDLNSGCRIEKGLRPGEVLRSKPQQRTHPVYNDGDYIWYACHCV